MFTYTKYLRRAAGYSLAASLMGSVAFVGSAYAAEEAADEAPVFDEIIVTSTKRAESIQDIPISVTAISQETLELSGAVEFADYATSVPNLSFGFAGEGRQTSRQFQLRGISGRDTTAFYINETAVPTTMDPRVIDVNRIEVLRGPQGSLFGARSMGGLVRLVTNQPSTDDVYGNVHAGFGTVHEGGEDYQFDATVNIPIADNAAFKATAYYIKDGGFIDRQVDPDASTIIAGGAGQNGDEFLNEDVNEDETYGFAASLLLNASENISITPSIIYQKTDSDGPAFVDNDVENLVKVRQFDVDEIGRDEWYLASVEASIGLDAGQIVTSVSYFDRETLDVEDGSLFMMGFFGPPVAAIDDPVTTREVSDQNRFTAEARFVSEFEGPVNFIAGVFYQKVETEGGFPVDSIIPGGSPIAGLFGLGTSFFSSNVTTDQEEIGFFGEVTLDVTEQLSITAGGRWFDVSTTSARSDAGSLFDLFGAPVPGQNSQSDNGFNPRVAVEFAVNDDVSLYANVAKGFRPGGANASEATCAAFGTIVPSGFESDSLWNYEGGFKSTLAEGRVTFNASAFHIVWSDRQTSIANCGGLGFGAIDNVGQAKATGFEAEMSAYITDSVSLSGGIGYVDARVTDTGGIGSVEVGDPLFNVPEWNGAAALDINVPISDDVDGYSRIDFRYVGSSISAQGNERPEYTVLNARIGAQLSDGWDVSLYANNILDKRANFADPTELSDALDLIAVSRPRTFGIDLRKEF